MRIPRALVALPVTLILGLTLGGPSAVADPPAPPGSKASLAGQEHRSDQAEQALADVQAILAGHDSRQGGTRAADRSLTVALRDLAVLKDALSAEDQRTAERVLARPAATKRACTPNICVHYTRTGTHAPRLRDANNNNVPDYIDTVRKTVNAIHVKYKKAGYRSPLKDGQKGGDSRTDIYIRDIGSQGIYGYCTTDDPRQRYDRWAFCVLDNNYSKDEFPTNTPIENMKVTAAHEYFHAVQFAYDSLEDGWILESTATWVEDEMFDSVNDNRNYLPNSPMSAPYVPLDYFGEGFHYGTWIFWRFLTENFTASSAGLPTLVRDVWRRLDGRAGSLDEYSLQGLEAVLAARGSGLTREVAYFVDANRHPGDVYDEGGAYGAFPPGPEFLRSPTPASPGPFTNTKQLDHLSSTTVRYVPSSTMTAGNWQLALSFNLGDSATRPAAMVTRFRQDGTTVTQRVTLDGTGAGALTVPFSVTTYEYVEITLVNVSNRFNCFVPPYDSPYSCIGVPLDDNVASSVTGTASQS